MKINQLIGIHNNLSKVKNKILSTCFQGNCKDTFGEFSNTSYHVFWDDRLKSCYSQHALSNITNDKRFIENRFMTS